MSSYSLTKSRAFQYVGILLALAAIAAGYWYFAVRAGVKTNTTAGSSVGDGGLGTGLVGYWKLDENTGTSAADSSTNAITTLTLTNGPVWTTGQIGSGIDFDGTDDYATTADTATLDFGDTDDITITGWFNRTTTFNSIDTVVAKRNSNTAADIGYIINIDNTTDLIALEVSDGTDEYSVTSTTSFTAAGWHHFAFVWDQDSATNVEVYIDGRDDNGTKVGTIGNVGDISNAVAFRLGAESDNGNPFDGLIDEVRIYDRVLTPTEITDLYKLTVPTAVDTGLKGYWAFGADDIRGTLVSDRSGARNTGTLVNAPAKAIGRIGQALNFSSASTQYINAGSGASIDDIVNLSSCAWLNPNSSLTTYGDIIAKFQASPNTGWQFSLDFTTLSSLRLSFYRSFSTDGHWLSAGPLPYNVWSHVCVTYNNSSTANDPILYVNGVSVGVVEATAPSGTLSGDATGDIYLGAFNAAGTPGELFNGQLDEIYLYNRIITASEVKALYDAGSANKVNTGAAQPGGTGNPDSGLVGYWKLDEGTGTSAADSSVNATAAGTLTNGPTWGTGRIGSAVTFDGTNDYIALSDPANGVLDFGDTDDMTISGWFNRSTYTTLDIIVSKWDGVNPGYRVYIDDANDSLHFQLFDGTDTYAIDANGYTITAAGWHHFVAIWDQDSPANSEIYVDGLTLNATDSGTIGNIGTLANTVALSIGDTPGASGQFAGSLDEIRIYDRAYSAEDVNMLYNQTAATGIDTGLRGYWSFNANSISGTTAYDRSGNRNAGTLTNGPTKTIGRIGQALTLDGTNDYVTMSDIAALDGLTAVTASAWVKTTVLGVEKHIVNKANCTGTTDSAVFELFGGFSAVRKPEFAFYKSGGSPNSYNAVSTLAIDDGNWHLVTGTYDGVKVRIYVDGVETGSVAASSVTAPSVTYPVEVGGCTATPSYPWNGGIDEVRLYSRALSAAEVKALYDIGAPDKTNTSASTPQGVGNPDSGLAAYWKLDENTGTSAADSSTNASTAGTLTNGPVWAAGQINRGVNFDGTNDHINAGSPAVLDNMPLMTACAWIFPETIPATFAQIVSKDDVSNTGWDLEVTNVVDSTPRLGYWRGFSGTDGTWRAGADSIVLNTWQHVCASFDNSSAANVPSLYINGAKQVIDNSTTPTGTADTDAGANVCIGCLSSASTPAELFDGTIDEVRIYNRILSDDEVMNLSRQTAPTGTDTGLKGYWSFNGRDVSGTTAYDRSGAGNTGTLTNGPIKVIGKLGQALNFDDTNDYVAVADNAVLDFGDTANFTITGWFNRETFATNDTVIAKKNGILGTDTGYLVYLAASDDKIHVYLADGVDSYDLVSSSVFDSVGWNHFAFVWDQASAANSEIYVNGAADIALDTGTIANINDLSNALELRFGAESDAGQPFDGSLDEVRLYNRILTAAEIQALYNSGR